MNAEMNTNLVQNLWRLYDRVQPARPWLDGNNLPWNDPAFSRRMLREHLDQSHGAASRQQEEIRLQLDWLWEHLALRPGNHILDITCGPGLYAVPLAEQGMRVTGIDFSPASVQHARELAAARGVADRCTIIEADVRQAMPQQVGQGYDAALFIYGQLSVFPRDEAAQLVRWACQALRPGGRLVVELLDYERVDKTNRTWWFTDDAGLWSDSPFLSLGERFWDDEQRASIDRFFIIDLQSGNMETIGLSDNGYETEEMLALLRSGGFGKAWAYPAWDDLPLYDANEWMVYVAER